MRWKWNMCIYSWRLAVQQNAQWEDISAGSSASKKSRAQIGWIVRDADLGILGVNLWTPHKGKCATIFQAPFARESLANINSMICNISMWPSIILNWMWTRRRATRGESLCNAHKWCWPKIALEGGNLTERHILNCMNFVWISKELLNIFVDDFRKYLPSFTNTYSIFPFHCARFRCQVWRFHCWYCATFAYRTRIAL